MRTEALLFALASSGSHACAGAAAPSVTSTDSVGIPVDDLERSVAFYTQVLDFKAIEETRSRR